MHILIIGAHPDDGESNAGGTAALWRRRGDDVRFISVADGRRGHYDSSYAKEPESLAARRSEESKAAAAVIGASAVNLKIPDGEIDTCPNVLQTLVREIRAFGPAPGTGPSLIVTHRPFDHPRDHRLCAQLVIDAAAAAALPLVCPDTPAVPHVPAIAYWQDDFKEAVQFRPDVIVAIDDIIEVKTRLFAAHESQVFEWLPYNNGTLEDVPSDSSERLAWLRRTRIEPMGARVRAACAESLDSSLPHGRYAEAFQISEYGGYLSHAERHALFPEDSKVTPPAWD